LILFASSARADAPADTTSFRFTLALQVMTYRPPLESLFTVEKEPFRVTYGTSPRPLGRLELGFGKETAVGLWSVALGAGFWRATGQAHDLSAALDPSDNAVSLRMIPLSVALVWRGDFLRELTTLPFVPFVRLGYGVVPWDTGRVSADQPQISSYAFGLEYGGGLQIVLDDVEPRFTENARQEIGLRSTSLYIDVSDVLWRDPNGPSFQTTTVGGGLLLVF
jgi:hypothetical protein